MNKYEVQYTNEVTLLSSLMNDNSLIEEVTVSSRHFLNEHNKYIFRIMRGLQKKGEPYDFFSLHQLGENHLHKMGGDEYLTKVFQYAAYKNISFVQEQMMKFIAVDEALEKTKTFLQDNELAHNVETLNELLKGLNEIEVGNTDEETFAEMLQKECMAIENMEEGFSGTPTGFGEIDVFFDGWQPADLIIVAARPSVGKTAFIIDSFRRATLEHSNVMATFFSCEMAKEKVVRRFIAVEGGIFVHKMRNPKKYFDQQDWQKYSKAYGDLSTRNIQINDKKHINDIRQVIRKTVKEYPNHKHIFGIDHLGHVKTGQKFNSKHEEFGYIVNELKAIAKQYKVPIILVAQLNRANEKTADKEPTLADIRESGTIEEVADFVIFPHRPAYYDKSNKEEAQEVQLIFAKSRDGFTGKVAFTFFPKTNRFKGGAHYDTKRAVVGS